MIMNKLVLLLVVTLLTTNFLIAQTSDKLTNSTIIRMAKARLSDEIIIDEINNSEVNFNLCPDSLKYLSNKNVSAPVLDAMKAANDKQISNAGNENSIPINLPEREKVSASVNENSTKPQGNQQNGSLNQAEPGNVGQTNNNIIQQPLVVKANESVKLSNIAEPPSQKAEISETAPKETTAEIRQANPITKPASSVNAINYVIPMEELIRFFDKEFNSFADVISKWDQQIRKLLEDERQLRNKISDEEKDLTQKKNSDSKAFTQEIISLKNNLSKQRESLKQWKTQMLVDGANVSKELKGISNSMNQSIDKTFNQIGSKVNGSNSDPSLGETNKEIMLPQQKFNDNIISYIAPVKEMLVFYQNETLAIEQIIAQWSEKALAIIKKDAELNSKLAPLKKELTDYQLTPKKYKAEISGLKKQCDLIEKDRKYLNKQMENDSKELSKFIKNQLCKDVQSSVEERFNDIIENINYYYLDDFSGSKN
jgi:hypothetical protein